MPFKMVSHNNLLTVAEGGETAFSKAKDMGISLVRYDFRWHQMATRGGWVWNGPAPNQWADRLEPALRWTKVHGMRTLVNLLAYKPPGHVMEVLREAWPRWWPLSERRAALWAAWASQHGVAVPSSKEYVEALVDRLAQGQQDGDWDIAGFCVLNEPNTRWPAERNWKHVWVGGGDTYSTADYCADMCKWVKGRIRSHHQAVLGHAVTVVNLYSYRGHWLHPEWRRVAASPDLDVLGIDIYWDQALGLFARGKPQAMAAISGQHGKPWWLVETAGADGPGLLLRRPSCEKIGEVSRECEQEGAEVLGYYRLWGDRPGPLDFAGAYCIFVEPGNGASPREDGHGEKYWETIQGL